MRIDEIKIIKSFNLNVIQISKIQTKILSANKSSKAPSSSLIILSARYASRKSVIEAAIKVAEKYINRTHKRQ